MQFEKAHCLFERSGTFKRAFQKLGFPAYDYDLENTEAVDFDDDIFANINLEYGKHFLSIFSDISCDDLVLAFFPCTYFSDQSQLLSRGDSFGQKTWCEKQKLEYSLEQMQRRAEYFELLCKLCLIAIDKGFKLVIENPYGKVNFLKHFFPLRPEVIILDRRIYGDFFKKPTQFFFINCTPEFHLFNECIGDKPKNKVVEDIHGFERSKISDDFAENFIRQFIL